MATARLNRRRFLTLAACAAGYPSLGHTNTTVAHWRGIAMGAEASLKLVGVDQSAAAPIFLEIEAELLRLENVFSLYRSDSALSSLNRDQVLPVPPPELLELFSLVDGLHSSTQGAFDPTVQPLWALYAASAAEGRSPGDRELTSVLARTGWQNVRFDNQEVSFATPEMALTLNGIAQGYVTDKIAELLRDRGFENVLVNMGEIAAVGHRQSGEAWRVGIATPDIALIDEITLSDRAVATSAPMGTLLDPAGRIGHIIDPRDGSAISANRSITISSHSAAVADGLSTACCVLEPNAIPTVLSHWQDAKLEVLSEQS